MTSQMRCTVCSSTLIATIAWTWTLFGKGKEKMAKWVFVKLGWLAVAGKYNHIYRSPFFVSPGGRQAWPHAFFIRFRIGDLWTVCIIDDFLLIQICERLDAFVWHLLDTFTALRRTFRSCNFPTEIQKNIQFGRIEHEHCVPEICTKYLRDIAFSIARLIFIIGLRWSTLTRQHFPSIRILYTGCRSGTFTVAHAIAFTPFAHFPIVLGLWRWRLGAIRCLWLWHSPWIRLLIVLIVIVRIEAGVTAFLVQRDRIRKSNQFIDRIVIGSRQNLRKKK